MDGIRWREGERRQTHLASRLDDHKSEWGRRDRRERELDSDLIKRKGN